MMISVDAENDFDTIQYSFMIQKGGFGGSIPKHRRPRMLVDICMLAHS